MSVDILGTSCDQCRSMVRYSFTSTETRRLVVRTDSPGRPPRLSHSSWTMIASTYSSATDVYCISEPTRNVSVSDRGCFEVFWCFAWRVAYTFTEDSLSLEKIVASAKTPQWSHKTAPFFSAINTSVHSTMALLFLYICNWVTYVLCAFGAINTLCFCVAVLMLYI